MTRVAVSLALLGVARLLPETGAGLYVRLAAAAIALLWPFAGAGPSAALAWSSLALAAALAVVFVLHTSLTVALVLYALAAVAYAVTREPRPRLPERERLPLDLGAVLAVGAALGIAAWTLARPPAGDALFHLARVRKLDDFGALSLHAVDEFRDGGLHPGYAFPLWHGFLAFVARLAGVDPTAVVEHAPSVLVPVFCLVAYEAGLRVFRSRGLAWAVLAAQLGLAAFAAGGGGALPALALPASWSQYVLATAVVALVFAAIDEPTRARYGAVAAASLALVLVHPTYADFLLVPLGGFLVARALIAGRDVKRIALALVAAAVPTAAVSLALLPLARASARGVHGSRHGIERYPGQVVECGRSCFHIAPQLVDRRGAIVVAALALVPLAGLARRSLWAALVLGGTVALLLLTLEPLLFVPFSHAVSLSQARRALAFLPLAFALAGGFAVLARALGPAVLAVGIGAGIWLQLAYPGNFGYVFGSGGGPAAATWIALFGGAAAIGWGALRRRPERFETRNAWAAAAAVALVVPVAVFGFRHWSRPHAAPEALPAGLVSALRTRVPERAVVFSDPETSYRISAYAPVYVAVSVPAHVADTKANRPYSRQADWKRFARSGSLAIPRRYGASYLVLDRRRTKAAVRLPVLWRDGRYALLRVK